MPWPGDAALSANTESDYFDLSPDGQQLAVVAGGQIWVRPLDSLQARAVTGTEGGTYPFWSPDGNSIGFFAGNELRRIPRDGGIAQKLCDAPVGRGGAWSPAGTIVFSGGNGELSRVEDRGGPPVSVKGVAAPGGVPLHRYPQFLPDGRHFLFTLLVGSKELAGVYVSDLDGTPPVRVLDGSEHALFAPSATPGAPGHLVFRRQDVLMAQPFDLRKLRVFGEMFPVAERVGLGNTGHGAFTVSATGVLAYSEQSTNRQVLTWVDRSGRRIGSVTGRSSLGGFAISPDEHSVVYASGGTGGRRDLWLQTTGPGSASRFTFGEGSTGWTMPLWSGGGARLVYATQNVAGEARYEVRTRRLDRTGLEETLAVSPDILRLWDSSPDGRYLLYSSIGKPGLNLLSLEHGAEPAKMITTDAQGCCGQFSPDGRFVAYVVGVGSVSQVFVRPFPITGALWQISTDGGGMPRWRGDGRAIYYRAADGKLMEIPVGFGAGSFEAGTPRPLFDGIPSSSSNMLFTYQPSKDGQRFLVSLIDAGSQSPITVVLNWQGAVRR